MRNVGDNEFEKLERESGEMTWCWRPRGSGHYPVLGGRLPNVEISIPDWDIYLYL